MKVPHCLHWAARATVCGTPKMHSNLLAVTQRSYQSFHSINHNSCKQTLSNPHVSSQLGKPLSEGHRPQGHQPQAPSKGTWRHAVSPQAHCTKSEHSSELGSQKKSTTIWLQQNHSAFMATGAMLTVQRGTRSYCLLNALSSRTSHMLSGLAAREQFHPEGHAWKHTEQIRKRNPEG